MNKWKCDLLLLGKWWTPFLFFAWIKKKLRKNKKILLGQVQKIGIEVSLFNLWILASNYVNSLKRK
jgi:hypothetical protein